MCLGKFWFADIINDGVLVLGKANWRLSGRFSAELGGWFSCQLVVLLLFYENLNKLTFCMGVCDMI